LEKKQNIKRQGEKRKQDHVGVTVSLLTRLYTINEDLKPVEVDDWNKDMGTPVVCSKFKSYILIAWSVRASVAVPIWVSGLESRGPETQIGTRVFFFPPFSGGLPSVNTRGFF
jgi:hypothetical protein